LLVVVLFLSHLITIVLQIGDIERALVYVSLASDMEDPVGVDPPMDNIDWCYRYTSSDEDDDHLAPTTDDWVTGKRLMARGLSRVVVVLTESVQGPSSSQGSTAGIRAPKHRWLLRVVDDDDKEEEAAPTLVRKPLNRPEVVPAPGE
jgi:hypothetical protein